VNGTAASNPHRLARRTAATVITAAVLTLLWTGCGRDSPSSAGAGHPAASSQSPSAVGYSACMRSHGVANFPDPQPGSDAAIPKADPAQLGVATSQLAAAQQACAQLIPGVGSTGEQQQETQCAMAGQCSQAVVQQWMSGLRTLAQCLRTHGVANWPDPIVDSRGLPHYPYDQAGIDHHSPQILAKVQQCANLTGFQGLPLP
jgi:hypothetical protein